MAGDNGSPDVPLPPPRPADNGHGGNGKAPPPPPPPDDEPGPDQATIDALRKALVYDRRIGAACRVLGIPGRTMRAWRARGREDQAAGRDTRYARLAQAVDQARQDWRVEKLRIIHEAAGDHQQETTHVERRPLVKDGRIVKGEDGRPIMVERVWRTTRNVKGDYRAACWLLEREEPERYAPRQKLEHKGGGGLVEILTMLRDDEPATRDRLLSDRG